MARHPSSAGPSSPQTARALTREEAEVRETAAWLCEHIRAIKTPTVGSYGMKHVMERATGTYVTNGVFIAAALIAGYPFKYVQPNVRFGMSARDVKRVDPSRQARR